MMEGLHAAGSSIPHAPTEVSIGNAVAGIIHECEKHQPDLLIMGLHPKGFFSRLLRESPELALVKKAPCPLLFIPEQ